MALKKSHRVPWWIFVIATLFLGDFLLQTYCRLFGRADFGFTSRTEGERRVVDLVAPGSSAERAGLKPGDVILAMDGQSIQHYSDRRIFLANLEINRAYRFEIEREGRRLELAIRMERVKVFMNWDQVVYMAWQFASLILLATALLIAFNRPFDYAARRGALALAMLSVSIFFTNLPPGYATIWRGLPRVVGALLWIPHICVYLFGPILLSFFVLFPRPLFRSRWPWIIIWLPALCFLPSNFRFAFLTVYNPGQAYSRIPPSWVDNVQVVLLGIYGLAAFATLAANYVRLTDANEKRRLRVLFVGGAAGVIPGLLRLVIMGILPESTITLFLANKFPDVLIALIFLLFPVCFAYSILRHRLLDIRVIIRRGLQYTLARRTLLSLVPALGVILALDLTLNSKQPLADILKARGWIYAGLSGLALVAYWRRKPWMEKLDRRFFREQYNSQQILASVLEDIHEAKSFERVAPRVVARIEAALHPEFISVMVRQPSERQYHSLSSVPSGQTTPPLAADSKLVGLARVLGKPLEVLMADTAWLEGRLPREEIDFARGARIDLLVPIGSAPGSTDAVLALGIKRSEEPYTREDQQLLEAISSSLALLFERWAPAPAGLTEAFEVCPQCGLCYDSGTGQCTQDGADLARIRLPRTLVGRYRLDRRLGCGGMGAVYEATDSGLERRVAVKVIRDDLVGSAEAAHRFQREARAAASFAHPNVVTVHDYGVAAERHAFLVMELLDGSTLREELRRCSRLEPPRTVEIFRGVCAAVDAAHRRQIIHRDLKPENIFLVRSEGFDKPEEMVKVLDFGIAKVLTSPDESAETLTGFETSAGILVGTIAYISPEQLLGERPSVLWDLWALSVVAYETLAGLLPFAGAPTDDWRQAVLAGRFTPLAARLKDPPAPWQAFFADCFAQDRTKRPQSAAEFFRCLEETLAST
jgi:tRNA A-37 threonylcarbamoyl transferase component Bud32